MCQLNWQELESCIRTSADMSMSIEEPWCSAWEQQMVCQSRESSPRVTFTYNSAILLPNTYPKTFHRSLDGIQCKTTGDALQHYLGQQALQAPGCLSFGKCLADMYYGSCAVDLIIPLQKGALPMTIVLLRKLRLGTRPDPSNRARSSGLCDSTSP